MILSSMNAGSYGEQEENEGIHSVEGVSPQFDCDR